MQRISEGARRGSGVALIVVVALLLVACDSIHDSKDFERHRYSQLSEPRDRDDVLYFDVKFDVNYPEDNEVAEGVRMDWLAAWLEQRKMCTDGFEIESQRPFDPMEYNPGQYDRRYVVKCKIVATG